MELTYWIGHHAAGTPNRVALEELPDGRVLTYGELDQRVRSLAACLHRSFGIGVGDRVVVLSPNTTRVIEVQEACRLIGAIFVPLNTRLAEPELAWIVGDAEPSLLIADQSFEEMADRLASVTPMSRLSWGGTPDEYEKALGSSDRHIEPHTPSEDDPFTVIYTSGTTGRPKGAITSHGSAFACVLNSLVAGGVSENSVNLTILPLFHVAGLNLFLNATLYAGGRTLIARTFDPDECLRILTDSKRTVSHVVGVPANYQFMARTEQFESATFGPLFAGVGGSASPDTLFDEWGRRGVELRNIYGITEGSSTVCVMPAGRGGEKVGSVGRAVMHARLRIVDEGGVVQSSGAVGELQVAGPQVGIGYWRRPEATVETFVDGWLRTGDAARLDEEGFCYIVDRWKDMYISGGENVYPTEVENVIYELDGVAEVAVVGVPDETWGETGLATVVPHDGATISAEEVIDWCRRNLAGFKAPSYVRFADELPRNAIGKIRKVELRDQWLSA